ncbi:protein kinase [Chloropicon primus]|uniref:Protein kinase n=2 Tax=Chloropicon primus TaxID=1764295 RepID=A0A5B8MRK4_9CHLO|nr:protein kinase [Chloropicon primus]|eukprot:QDZ22040.1 protein kinase [Chloropicon primus]
MSRCVPASSDAMNRREGTGFFSSMARAYKIYRLAAAVYFDYRRTRKRAEGVKRGLGIENDPDADEHPEIDEIWCAAHEKNARLLYDGILELKGLWVKAGQFLSSRPDVVPMEYVRVLSDLQDSIPPRPWAEVQGTLERELGKDWRKHFSLVDENPLSAASIAQVHVAVLKEGSQKVALKVMHKGIRKKMLQDLQNLRILTNTLAYFEPDQDYRKIVAEWRPAVKEELDLRREANNLKVVAQNMQDSGVKVKIPLPLKEKELCTESVLVMQFCEGFSPKDTEAMDAHGTDREVFMRRLCSAFAHQIHRYGFYHADPHPGNILVSTESGEDKSVPVLLDFGLVKSFPSDRMKQAFSKLIFSSYCQDLDQLSRSLVEMNFVINEKVKDPFRDLNNTRRLFSPTPMSRLKERKAVMAKERQERRKEEEEEERRSGPREKVKRPVEAWPSELVFFIRVTGLLKGLTSKMDIEFGYLQVMAETAIETVREAVPDEKRAQHLLYPFPVPRTELQKKLERNVQELSEKEKLQGLQCTVLKDGMLEANVAAGTVSEMDLRPATEKTLFIAFSVTKALLAAAVHLLVERGVVNLDDPVSKHWPEFGQEGKGNITVSQLLSHEAGLANAMPDLKRKGLAPLLDFEKMVDFVAKAPAQGAGTFNYHAISYCWLVGGLVKGATGRNMAEFIEKEFLEPAGLSDDLFVGGLPDSIQDDRIASVVNPVQLRQTGSVVEPLGAGFTNPTVFNMKEVRAAALPSANSHMTARGVSTLLSKLFLEGEPLLGPETLERVLSHAKSASTSASENSSLSRQQGLGFQVFRFRDLKTGEIVPAVGHLGVGGNAGFCIPREKVAVGITLNALHFGENPPSLELVRTIAQQYGLEPITD